MKETTIESLIADMKKAMPDIVGDYHWWMRTAHNVASGKKCCVAGSRRVYTVVYNADTDNLTVVGQPPYAKLQGKNQR